MPRERSRCPYCVAFGMRKCQDCRDGLTCTRAPGHDGDHVSCDVIGSHARHIWNDHDDGKENDGRAAD